MKYNLDEFSNFIECLTCIFTVEKSKVKVLLLRKKIDPYKGYWVLPLSMLSSRETIDECVDNIIMTKLGLPSINLEQSHVFSDIDRDNDNRLIGISFIGLIDSKTAELKREERPGIESAWFSIDELPKMGYDHNIVIQKSIEHLQKQIVNSSILKTLFPSDFTLPELQRTYEQILNIKLDRRNFRKKFVNLGMIKETGYKAEANNGRPAKLYCFNDNIKQKNLF